MSSMEINDKYKVTFINETNQKALEELLPTREYAETAISTATQAMGMIASGGLAPYGKLAVGSVLAIGQMVIEIAGTVYRFRYKLITTRALTAAEVFNEAIDWLDAMKETGRLDNEVWSITRKHLLVELEKILPSQ